ncbi:ABC transporter permease [Microbacterium lacticum]|uniref:ABC transporter permease n=1 Tax=Microbacterium lacticum TaxID=33885 RepID=UPI0028D167FA|nr:ABC transporter permease [Microbacterium lacticum]
MYWTYLRRELSGRRKQAAIVATGLGIAIALVIVVNALSAGVRDAQTDALASVYGVGTDLTVTGAQAGPGQGGGGRGEGGGRFDFGESGGQTSTDGTTQGTAPQEGQAPRSGDGSGDGGGGFGVGSFGVDSFSELGIDPAATTVGPLSAVTITDGRALASSDVGTDVVVLDATYAASNDLAVGGTLDIGGVSFEVVGIAASTSSAADTAANAYIPLDVAQSLSGAGDVVSTVYVQASSSDRIASVQSALQSALPDGTVSSQSELAATVSRSLSSAGSLITNLGTWLSIVVLAVAVALAVLFMISGISRRTRELGTLKAIGWSNRRVVGQVAGESVVQALIGGAAGVVLGIIAVMAIDVVSPTISSAPATSGRGSGAMGAGGGGGMGGGFGSFAQTASDIVLHAPLSLWIVLAAVLLAVAGGLVAGAFGGWRAARLSPAEALRSVA